MLWFSYYEKDCSFQKHLYLDQEKTPNTEVILTQDIILYVGGMNLSLNKKGM